MIKAIQLKATWSTTPGVGRGCDIDIGTFCLVELEKFWLLRNIQVFTARVDRDFELEFLDQLHEYPPPKEYMCIETNRNDVASWLCRRTLFGEVWLVPYNFEDEHFKCMIEFFMVAFSEELCPPHLKNVRLGELMKLINVRVPKRLRSGSFDNY